jgi:hypothetical protein
MRIRIQLLTQTRIRIRVQLTKITQIHADPDPQPWLEDKGTPVQINLKNTDEKCCYTFSRYLYFFPCDNLGISIHEKNLMRPLMTSVRMTRPLQKNCLKSNRAQPIRTRCATIKYDETDSANQNTLHHHQMLEQIQPIRTRCTTVKWCHRFKQKGKRELDA